MSKKHNHGSPVTALFLMCVLIAAVSYGLSWWAHGFPGVTP